MRIDELNGELTTGDEICYDSCGSVVQNHLKFTPDAWEDDLLRARVNERIREQIATLLEDAEIKSDYIHVIVRAEGVKK